MKLEKELIRQVVYKVLRKVDIMIRETPKGVTINYKAFKDLLKKYESPAKRAV